MHSVEPELLERLPLTVSGVEVQDPVLTLFGTGWYLTVACPWRGRVNGVHKHWEDPDIEEWLAGFVGSSLLRVDDGADQVVFVFTSGVINARPDTDLDPWVLAFPGGLIVGKRGGCQ